MKVGVITMHSVYNYGTQLQLLATQEKLKEYFDDVEFIDYRRENTYGKGLIKEYSKKNIIRFLAFMPTYYKWNKVFTGFQNKYLNITKKQYKDDNIESLNDKYDLFITGSDQVWNTGWNNGIIGPYYLNFVNNKPKYSYSSSFGIDKLNKDNIKEIKDYLSKYKRISVREKTGVKILKNQLKINNAIQILDPTLAYSKDFWKKYSTKRKIKEKYILVYNLNNNKDFDEYVKKAEKETGIKAYRFCTRYDQIRKPGKPLIIPDVLEFISLIENAEYVITDSFHATAFSINMHTHPICIYPKKYSNRLSDFLDLLNIEKNCKVTNKYDMSVFNKTIDYKKTDKVLNEERKKINDYLQLIKEDLK